MIKYEVQERFEDTITVLFRTKEDNYTFRFKDFKIYLHSSFTPFHKDYTTLELNRIRLNIPNNRRQYD